MGKKTQIYVMTHKECALPDIPGYIRMQVGSALHQDLGYVRDDICDDHISDLNPWYAELTGLYSIWRNTPDVDNIGMCHYRRYFINSAKKIMTMKEYSDILEKSDIIISEAEREKNRVYMPIYRAVDEVIRKIHPEDEKAWDESCNTSKGTFGNLFVMRSDLLDDYCTWLFDILVESIELLDMSEYDDYHKKAPAIVAEELLGVYVKSRGLHSTICRVGLYGEKKEAIELKKVLKACIELGKYSEGWQLYIKTIEKRPDLTLADADPTGELTDLVEKIRQEISI